MIGFCIESDIVYSRALYLKQIKNKCMRCELVGVDLGNCQKGIYILYTHALVWTPTADPGLLKEPQLPPQMLPNVLSTSIKLEFFSLKI